MNTNGNPGTLVPSHPGNTNAAKYGVHSSRLIEPRANEIEEGLVRSFEFTATQRIAVLEVAHCMAILEAIDLDLDERGLIDKRGEPRYLLNLRSRISRQLDHWLAKISPAIDRQTAREHDQRDVGRLDYVRELQRIALGDDSTATARDRLAAIERLSKLDSGPGAITQVTLHVHRDNDRKTTVLGVEPEGQEANEDAARREARQPIAPRARPRHP